MMFCLFPWLSTAYTVQYQGKPLSSSRKCTLHGIVGCYMLWPKPFKVKVGSAIHFRDRVQCIAVPQCYVCVCPAACMCACAAEASCPHTKLWGSCSCSTKGSMPSTGSNDSSQAQRLAGYLLWWPWHLWPWRSPVLQPRFWHSWGPTPLGGHAPGSLEYSAACLCVFSRPAPTPLKLLHIPCDSGWGCGWWLGEDGGGQGGALIVQWQQQQMPALTSKVLDG